MVEQVVQAAVESGGMSMKIFLLIIAALMVVITSLVELIKSLISRRTNPLNGTLGKLDSSIGNLNTILTKVEMRTSDSDRVLEGHTEKLVILSTTMAQLAASEARQTEALLGLRPAIDKSLTGCSQRIAAQCNANKGTILNAIGQRLDNGG